MVFRGRLWIDGVGILIYSKNVKGGRKVLAIFLIICIAAFVGGFAAEWKRQNRMTPSQQRQRQREHFQAAAGIITGAAVGTVTAAKTIIKKSGE